MTALLSRDPCDRCSSLGRETETGAGFCRQYGEQECEKTLAVDRLIGRAFQAATQIAREPNTRLRSAEAESTAECYYELISEFNGAEFDVEGFVASCNASRNCARCRTRDVADEYHAGCGECGLGVAA